ncbi:MAG TPA: DUF523 and DUF1722 domain-containing protein, partial [Gammaproteobacteria bacterium]|nr:DUF523 and DUF1722 domain-containing protein [Gammaproteobacteria bacterium]
MSDQQAKPIVGVSSCLTGKPVRFDGGHKHCRLITESWSDFLEFQPVCPEAEMGLGVPRPSLQLRETGQQIRLVFSKNPQHDLTLDMEQFSRQRLGRLGVLDGYIFKKDSPSCGLERVPVMHEETGQKTRDGRGVFARTFVELNPLVPTEEEGRLNDEALRENFLERVYCHYRWRTIADTHLQGFVDFHMRHKFMLMARNHQAYRELGRLVAMADRHNLAQIRQQYIQHFMQVMALCPTRGQHVNVLLHILGYFKRNIDSSDKHELLNWFDAYRSELVPRITPVALLRHYLRLYPQRYIA